MEETGGKIFRSNGIHPGDVRIALIADPLDTEIENRNEGTLEVLKAISTCSYVRVDSNRITGGRILRPANTRKPRPPQRSFERLPSQARSVSPVLSGAGFSLSIRAKLGLLFLRALRTLHHSAKPVKFSTLFSLRLSQRLRAGLNRIPQTP